MTQPASSRLITEATNDTATGTLITTPGSAIAQGLAQRNAPYQILATDHGVTPNVGADQTANLQAALNAAAATGADLLLPTGTINLLGQITWKCRQHSIIGTQGTILNWSSATFDGPAITLYNTVPAGTDGAVPVELRDVIINGPTSAATTVDGIQVAGYLNDNTQAVWQITLNRVSFHGFGTQEVIGTGSWLIHHKGCSYRKAVTYGVDIQAGTQAGEMYGWESCVFDNCPVGLHANQAGAMDAAFSHCSFDTLNTASIQAAGGQWTFDGCHFERAWVSGSPFIDVTGATGSHRPVGITMTGGVVVINNTVALPGSGGPFETVVVRTTTGAGIPSMINFDGVQVVNALDPMIMTLHKEVTAGIEWSTGYGQTAVSARGVGLEMRTSNATFARVSQANNLLVDGQMTAGGAFAIDPTSGDPTLVDAKIGVDKWVTANATTQSTLSWDTTKMVVGDRSLKISQAGYNNGLVQHYFAVEPRKTYHASFFWSCAAFTGATKARVTVYFYDCFGHVIGSRNLTNQISPSVVTGTVGWTFAGGIIQSPPGAALAQFSVDLSGGTGTFWLDDVQVVAIS